jgi:hypothetical protein
VNVPVAAEDGGIGNGVSTAPRAAVLIQRPDYLDRILMMMNHWLTLNLKVPLHFVTRFWVKF